MLRRRFASVMILAERMIFEGVAQAAPTFLLPSSSRRTPGPMGAIGANGARPRPHAVSMGPGVRRDDEEGVGGFSHVCHSRAGGNPETLAVRLTRNLRVWIPACAGMTPSER